MMKECSQLIWQKHMRMERVSDKEMIKCNNMTKQYKMIKFEGLIKKQKAWWT